MPEATPPKPRAKITCWQDVTEAGTPMARVSLDVGQFSFQAGSQYDPKKEGDFGHTCGNVINAIMAHAANKGWL